MSRTIHGGTNNYGQVAGILMTDSSIPRIPGDPGHAGTFAFPVRYGVVKGLSFEDVVECRKETAGLVIGAALELQEQGVNFVAADCGLFSIFQAEVAGALSVPFLGSALNLIPFLSSSIGISARIGVLTGDTRLLREEHLRAAGADPERLIIRGMEKSREFQQVVVERGLTLHVEHMRQGVLEAAEGFSDESVGAVVLECTNLISFRADIQALLGVPVFDMVSLIELFAGAYRLRRFEHPFLEARRPA